MKKVTMAVAAAVFSMFIASDAMAKESAPMAVDGATTVDVKKAEALFNDDSVIFVDPRKQADFDRGHVPGAIHLDIKGKSTSLTEKTLADALEGDKNAKVVFYCNGENCLRSPDACKKAVSWGFKNVFFFRDGFPAWKAAGLPVE